MLLFYGTLLGWNRECTIIPHTTDVDLVILAEEFQPKFEEILKASRFFRLRQIQGLLNDSRMYKVLIHGKQFDLFFFYPNEEKGQSGLWVGMLDGGDNKLR